MNYLQVHRWREVNVFEFHASTVYEIKHGYQQLVFCGKKHRLSNFQACQANRRGGRERKRFFHLSTHRGITFRAISRIKPVAYLFFYHGFPLFWNLNKSCRITSSVHCNDVNELSQLNYLSTDQQENIENRFIVIDLALSVYSNYNRKETRTPRVVQSPILRLSPNSLKNIASRCRS